MVKACVAQGTHHVDISGEPQFLETMQLKYNDEAEKKGIYIVGSCGFDSIPSDLGKQYGLHENNKLSFIAFFQFIVYRQ